MSISVIIPVKNNAELTICCLRSLLAYGVGITEIIIVDNDSNKANIETIKKFSDKYKQITILDYRKPFNYQKLNNWAVKHSLSDYLLFLNNDTELVKESTPLLLRMRELAAKQTVGATGGLLLYKDKKHIQHGGVYLYPGGLAEHKYVFRTKKEIIGKNSKPDFDIDLRKDQKMSAITGAAMLIEKRKFDAVGGFDEHFRICGGDVDLCLRLNAKGYQTFFASGGYIIHKESMSRKRTSVPYEDFYWSYQSYIKGYDWINGDPFMPNKGYNA